VNGYDSAPIFDDLITNCNLPAISWVIPDGAWSDHPSSPGKGVSQKSWALGPFWVGDIIDAVGTACQGKYWSGTEPTAVIVTWDDWGGWYDHIPPWAFYGLGKLGENGKPIGGWNGTNWYCGDAPNDPPNGWGCGYVSGFRVPLLVVSPYTGTCTDPPTCTTFTGYVSGACGPGQPVTTCPNPGQYNVYVHDFGSILAFTEWNFGFNNPKFIAEPYYADYNAPDWGGNPGGSQVPLMDFFQLTTPRPFVSVSIQNNPWPYTCFTKWGTKQACNGITGPYVPLDADAY